MRQTPLYFLYGYLVSIAMAAVGGLWCFAPARFLVVYRRWTPFRAAAQSPGLERAVHSGAGRTVGLLLACWGLWIVLLLSAQLVRLHGHPAD